MSAVLVAMMVVPLVAAAASWWGGSRLASAVTVASGTAIFGLALALVPEVARAVPLVVPIRSSGAQRWLTASTPSQPLAVGSGLIPFHSSSCWPRPSCTR